MYLLMLLATYMSAIYGYNLSARPDYDRDIVRKKAMSVLLRFIEHHSEVTKVVSRVSIGDYSSDFSYILPGDLIYSDHTETGEGKGVNLVYDQAKTGTEKKFYLRKISGISSSANVMQLGKRLYGGDEMITKIICLDRDMSCTDSNSEGYEFCEGPDGNFGHARTCEVVTDPSDPSQITETCCNIDNDVFLVSYKKVDAQWLSKITGVVGIDFTNAIKERQFYNNIGVISWQDGAWQFRGRMKFIPSYRHDEAIWYETHSLDDPYPSTLKERTAWTLPVGVFDQGFFKDMNGNDMCEKGCIFTIKQFL